MAWLYQQRQRLPSFTFPKFQAKGRGMVGMNDDLLLHLTGTLYVMDD